MDALKSTQQLPIPTFTVSSLPNDARPYKGVFVGLEVNGVVTPYFGDGTATWAQVGSGVGGGNVATDNIWAAAGDVLLGTGVHTGGRLPIGSIGAILTVTGANTVAWAANPGGGDATRAGNLSQFAATTSAQLAGVLSDETGFTSGALAVFGNNPTLNGLTLNGLMSSNGSFITAANPVSVASNAGTLDPSKGLNTAHSSAAVTFGVTANPATANTWFSLYYINDSASTQIVTFSPGAFSNTTQTARSSWPVQGNGELYVLFRWDGAGYKIIGDGPFLNNYAATAAPATTDDGTKGYGPGSLWLNTSTGTTYICQSAGTNSAIWDPTGTSSVSYASVISAGGTTTLTVGSARDQFLTGTLAQSYQMPAVGTLLLGQSFNLRNTSTGLMTVVSSGSNTIATVPSGATVKLTCISNSGTTAASWDFSITAIAYPFTPLTFATSQPINAALVNLGIVATANFVPQAPTNIFPGQPMTWLVQQDGTGGRTMDLASSGAYMASGGAASIQLSPAPNAADLVTMIHLGPIINKFWVTIQKAGS